MVRLLVRMVRTVINGGLMKIQYELSVSEIKALIELIAELCRRNGIDEVISRSLFKKLNEKHFN